MGTHPIFESDFDCLTEKLNRNDEAKLEARTKWKPMREVASVATRQWSLMYRAMIRAKRNGKSVKSASTRPVAVTLASSHARGARVSSGGTFRRMPSSSV